MRKLSFLAGFLAVVAVLGVAADFAAARAAEAGVSSQLQRRYDLGSAPQVSVRDRPFLLSLARGTFGTVDVRAAGVPVGGARADDLQARLEDLRVPLSAARGQGGTVTVGRVAASARLPQEAVQTLVRERLPGATVRLEDGVAVVDVPPGPATGTGAVTARVRPVARGGQVALEPQEVTVDGAPLDPALLGQLQAGSAGGGAPGALGALQLPALPAGAVLDDVRVERGTLVVTGTLGPLTFDA